MKEIDSVMCSEQQFASTHIKSSLLVSFSSDSTDETSTNSREILLQGRWQNWTPDYVVYAIAKYNNIDMCNWRISLTIFGDNGIV